MDKTTFSISETQNSSIWFFATLVIVTLLPLLSLPFLASIEFPFDGSLLLGLAVFAGGVGHVASTASVYVDKSVREVMTPRPKRFYQLPIIIILITIAALIWGEKTALSDNLVATMFLVHLLWLHYHYQKQNYGLVAFAGASIGTRIPFRLAWVLLLPALAGCLAVMPTLLESAFANVTYWQPAANIMQITSVLAYLCGAVFLVYLIFLHPQVFRQIRVAIFTLGAFCFFLPAILMTNTEYAFWSYALAHGFQYLLMVYILGRGKSLTFVHTLAFICSVAFGGLFIHKLAGNNALFLCGILLTWVHFVVDARLWKMSDSGPRKLIQQRFAFLFARQ